MTGLSAGTTFTPMLRQGELLRGDRIGGIVANPVRLGIGPGEEGGVGGKGQGDLRVGALEEDSLGGQPVDRRCLGCLVSVASQVVRPERIDSDKQQVRAIRGFPAGGQEEKQCRDKKDILRCIYPSHNDLQ